MSSIQFAVAMLGLYASIIGGLFVSDIGPQSVDLPQQYCQIAESIVYASAFSGVALSVALAHAITFPDGAIRSIVDAQTLFNLTGLALLLILLVGLAVLLLERLHNRSQPINS